MFLESADQGAQAATACNDPDMSGLVGKARKVLQQAHGHDAVGQLVDAVGIDVLTGVHVREIERVQREILDRSGGDGTLFHRSFPCLRRGVRVIGASPVIGRGEGVT